MVGDGLNRPDSVFSRMQEIIFLMNELLLLDGVDTL
jgi:hypothetical protein